MEYLPKGDLHKCLNSPLPEKQGQSIVYQLLEGLIFMHDHGFTHRDLKPANILVVHIGPDWWVKIADFGITKRATEGLTALRTRTGTPAFTAPEVLGFFQPGDELNNSYTNAVDVWSLGVITFLILTGETLFKDQRLLGRYVMGNFTFPSSFLLANKVSEEGHDFVKRLMAPKSEDRPRAVECLQHSWLHCLIEAPESQSPREIKNSKPLPITLSYSNPEPSARWSTQDQIPAQEVHLREEINVSESSPTPKSFLDPKKPISMLLNSAAKSGRLEVVKLLLDRGADISVSIKNGWTPLDSAV
ncbi:MAG: hypothetical protein Q9164_007797 [Protoblastenia rupestris]